MTKQPVHQQNCEVQINLCLFKKEEINRRYHVLYCNYKFTVYSVITVISFVHFFLF